MMVNPVAGEAAAAEGGAPVQTAGCGIGGRRASDGADQQRGCDDNKLYVVHRGPPQVMTAGARKDDRRFRSEPGDRQKVATWADLERRAPTTEALRSAALSEPRRCGDAQQIQATRKGSRRQLTQREPRAAQLLG